MSQQTTRFCTFCREPISAGAPARQKYCGRPCFFAHRRSQSRVVTICAVCGSARESLKVREQKYCSRACAATANYRNLGDHAPPAPQATCEQCGKQFTFHTGSTRGRFCSQKCYGRWQSSHVVGNAHPSKGLKRGRPKHFPPPLTLCCAICGEPFVVKPCHSQKRRCCSRKCAGVLRSLVCRGENSPTWKGGYEPYYGPSWRSARRAARKRDKCCQRCGITPEKLGKQLDVHHIVRFGAFGAERHETANALSNLICYCPTCHLLIEPRNKGKKSS